MTINLFRANLQVGQALTSGAGACRSTGLAPSHVREVQLPWPRWSTTSDEV